MKERFYAPDKTSELLDRLVKEQYEAGEVEVAHDLSNLRGMMMPFTLKDTREWEAWRNQFHKTDEQNGFPKHDVIVQGGIDTFNKLAKDVTKVSDAELEQFMKDKFNTTDTTDFVATSINPLFGMSLINNDVYGLPNVHHHPFGDPQQLTEQCLKCRGTGLNSFRERCQRCKGTGRA